MNVKSVQKQNKTQHKPNRALICVDWLKDCVII